MLSLAFDRLHRVLLSRFSGRFTEEDIDRVDRAVMLLLGREGPVRGILDLSEVVAVDVPRERFVHRARQPQIAAGQERVLVVNQPALLTMAQAYVALQREFGSLAPRIVATRDEADRLLELDEPAFEPMNLPSP